MFNVKAVDGQQRRTMKATEQMMKRTIPVVAAAAAAAATAKRMQQARTMATSCKAQNRFPFTKSHHQHLVFAFSVISPSPTGRLHCSGSMPPGPWARAPRFQHFSFPIIFLRPCARGADPFEHKAGRQHHPGLTDLWRLQPGAALGQTRGTGVYFVRQIFSLRGN